MGAILFKHQCIKRYHFKCTQNINIKSGTNPITAMCSQCNIHWPQITFRGDQSTLETTSGNRWDSSSGTRTGSFESFINGAFLLGAMMLLTLWCTEIRIQYSIDHVFHQWNFFLLSLVIRKKYHQLNTFALRMHPKNVWMFLLLFFLCRWFYYAMGIMSISTICHTEKIGYKMHRHHPNLSPWNKSLFKANPLHSLLNIVWHT